MLSHPFFLVVARLCYQPPMWVALLSPPAAMPAEGVCFDLCIWGWRGCFTLLHSAALSCVCLGACCCPERVRRYSLIRNSELEKKLCAEAVAICRAPHICCSLLPSTPCSPCPLKPPWWGAVAAGGQSTLCVLLRCAFMVAWLHAVVARQKRREFSRTYVPTCWSSACSILGKAIGSHCLASAQRTVSCSPYRRHATEKLLRCCISHFIASMLAPVEVPFVLTCKWWGASL